MEVEEKMSVQLSLKEGRRKGRNMSCTVRPKSWSRSLKEVALKRRMSRRLRGRARWMRG